MYCPNCGKTELISIGENTLVDIGVHVVNATAYFCNDCGHGFTGSISIPSKLLVQPK